MANKYAFLNKEKTIILRYYNRGESFFWINDSDKEVQHKNPPHDLVISEGYTLVVDSGYDPATQKEGPDIIDGETVHAEVINKDPQEIQLYMDTLIIYTKSVAYQRIIVIIPEWKQRNLTARATELQEIREESGGVLAKKDDDELQAIRAIFVDQVKPIRAASDLIELEVNNGTVTAENEIKNHILWP